jgi:hypothetical protein
LNKNGRACKSTTNCSTCKVWRKKWRKYIKDINLIIANSHFTRNIYIKNGFDPQNIIVNYPGIDIARVDKIRYLKSNILRFAFLGTVIKEKGIEVLIDAFNGLDMPASLEIWGRNDYYKCSLLKRIKNLNIEIKGEYDFSNIKDILSGIDIVIIPSIWLEPWSIVKIEALAAGLGVLASSAGGIPEAIGDSKVLFFEPNNVTSLLKVIKSVIANKALWQAKKKNNSYIKTIREDGEKIGNIYTYILSSRTRALDDKRYIVGPKNIRWQYSRLYNGYGVLIYQFDGKWKLKYLFRDTGARFWELFTAFKPFDEIVNIISDEYAIGKREAEKDLRIFMHELRKAKIITEAPDNN